jgi:hypothetical protein
MSKKTKFVKINKILDNEHDNMFKTIDTLYNICYRHWKTEEKMYKKGLAKLPDEHDNVKKLWKSHEQEHKNLLKQIKDMKKNIIKHIKERDSKHFHWT